MKVGLFLTASFFFMSVCLAALPQSEEDRAINFIRYLDEDHSEYVIEGGSQGEESGLSNTFDNIISKRGENVVLTEFLTTLNQSGQGVEISRAVCTNPLTQSSVIDTIVDYLKQENFTYFLSASDESNLALDITLLFLKDYDVFDGLVSVIKTLRSNGSSSSKREYTSPLEKRSLLGSLDSVLGSTNEDIINTLITLFKDDQDLESNMVSLDKSGLAVSVLADSLTDSDFKEFVVELVTEIKDEQALTFTELYSAVKATHLLNHITSALLGNSEYRILLIKFIIYIIKNFRSIF